MGRERLNDIDCFGCGEGVGEQIFGSDKVSYEIIFDRKKQQIYMSRKKKFNFFLVFVVFSIISCGLIYLYYPLHQEYTQYSIFDLSDQTINEIDKSSFRGVSKITLKREVSFFHFKFHSLFLFVFFYPLSRRLRAPREKLSGLAEV